MEPAALCRGLNVGDAQHLRDAWRDLEPPTSILTSPPYLDMHDYGNTSPIGARGQPLSEYLLQMSRLFEDCGLISTPDATMWLVAGAIRRSGRLIALPDKLATCAEQAGWVLRESITWDKQKALPWTHHGELRDVTEQVLLFSKADDFRFDADDLRSPIPNSVWWRRFPERYSPNGRMPTNLWSIPIPTQGSWTGLRSHICPFPEELTHRMLSLTTVQGDTVLDPLAGIGSVPAMAEAMGRTGYGLELTAEYAERYEQTFESAKRFLALLEDDSRHRDAFRETIIELRLLKFAKLLGKQITEAGFGVSWVRASKSCRQPAYSFQVASGDFELVLCDESMREPALAAARRAIQRKPLSKFGIDADIIPVGVAAAAVQGHWYASGYFWNPPCTDQPQRGEPHVVANFRPDPDSIDDTPYP